jgi:hypothetical protein
MDIPSNKLFTAVLAGMVMIPVATSQASFRFQNEDLSEVDAKPTVEERAIDHRTDWRTIRRAYAKALNACRTTERHIGEPVLCPVFNDLSTYSEYLKGVNLSVHNRMWKKARSRASAPQPTTSVDTDKLDSSQRLLLRRYTRAGFCPQSLKKHSLKGFYDLCRSIVGEDVSDEAPTGIVNDKVKLRQSLIVQPKTLKSRLQMIREARDASNRREDGSGPTWPTRTATDPW